MMFENTASDTTGSFTADASDKMIFGTENIPKRIRKNKPMPYQVVTHDIVENADVCIIGSGAAGAILANKILKGIEGVEGKNVILIEKGGYYDPEDFNQRGDSMMKVLWKNGGIQFTDDLSLVIAQGECLGGSTTINDAVCFDTPQTIKEEWRGEPYFVDIDDDKWKKAIDEVRESISVERLTPDDVSKEKNKNAWILKDACDKHKKKGSPDPYLGQPNERNCKDCATCGTCHYGCHYQTKQDMLNTYIFEALHLKTEKKPKKFLKIYCNCDVRKINYETPENPDVDNKKKIATGVEGKFLGQNGIEKFKLKVNAKIIILAAGSIASSALLLSNNIASDRAGKGLALHPSTTLIAKFPDEVRASEGIPMAYSCEQFSVLNYKNNGKKKGGFMLESIFTPVIQFSLMLPYHLQGEILKGHHDSKDLMKEFQYYAMAGVMVRDDPVGSIELSKQGNPKINYKLKGNEIDNLVEGVEELANLFFDAGAEHVITRHGNSHILTKRDEITQLAKEIREEHQEDMLVGLGSAHPQGGNRMGKDHTYSVVDKNCKVHEFDNLFVCDASVFPTSLGVNPQITVMSLATMTANNILENWNDFENIDCREHVKDTCDIAHPRTCGLDTLSIMFNQTTNNGTVDELVNVDRSDQNGWSFDKTSLMISNNFHWRGFMPDPELPEMIPKIVKSFLDESKLDWYDDYLEGFWKEFHQNPGENVKGNLNIYLTEKTKDMKIIPKLIHHEIYGDVIKLTYPKLPFVYDLLKIINENNIIGKVFLSFTPLYPDLELAPFVMTKDYSAEWMDDDDHDRIIKGCKVGTDLEQTVGYWALRIVRKSLLSPVVEVFHFKDKKSNEDVCRANDAKAKDDDSINTTEKFESPFCNLTFDYEKQLLDHISKIHHEDALKEILLKDLKWIDDAASLNWTNHIYKVNENFMVGKLVSSPLNKIITEQSEHIEKISEGKESYVIRYTLSTVAGSWIRDQD